jgi:hypothetical protein
MKNASLPIGVMSLALSCHAAPAGPAPGPKASDVSAKTASAGPAPSSPESAGSRQLNVIALPGGAGGIGFDDLVFSHRRRLLLVPAGRTGQLDVVDPQTKLVTAIAGFSAAEPSTTGHDFGTTSADEGRGVVFAIDRTTKLLHVVDEASRKIVASEPLAGSPDYVRWVETTGEVWVTEPDEERIEIFAVPNGAAPTPKAGTFIKIAGGPESLVIDNKREWAFTHLWKGSTIVIDLRARAILGKWKNGCEGSRGIALDETRGHLFVGCSEGKVATLDVDHEGQSVGEATTGSGVDIIAFSPERRHLYAPGANSATMAILDVADSGALRTLARVPTASGAHCVAADDRGGIWLCDPAKGQLLFVRDDY